MEITEALAIELTKNLLINGQDEKPLNFKYWPYHETVTVTLSDKRVLIFNRTEVLHARLMIGEKNED